MSTAHAALQITDILEEIVGQLAPEMEWTDEGQRRGLAAMSRVSQTFHVPANRVLWTRLPSLFPLLLLLPEFDRAYQARLGEHPTEHLPWRLSEPITQENWTRFRARAALVRTLLERGPHWEQGILDEESWSYLTRLSDGAPLLPSLRVLHWWPATTGEDLRLLASPLLRTLALHHILPPEDQSEDRVLLAVRDMFSNTPTLTEFQLINCHGDFFTRIDLTALQKLKAVWHISADTEMQEFPMKWLPQDDELLVLAALPALEHLWIELALDREPDLVGFSSLRTLYIMDNGYDATHFLPRCASPDLRELTIDFSGVSSPVYVESVMGSELPRLCTTIAQRFPQLRCLKVERSEAFIADSPETFLAATQPLLVLRDLTTLSLYFGGGALVLSDAVFDSFAEAWPALTSLTICVRSLSHSATTAPHPATVTLRALRAFSRRCPLLRELHIPHLHVAAEDCKYAGGSEPSSSHRLRTLAVCRAVVADERACALALHHIFPQLDTDASRELYSSSNHSEYADWEQQRRFGTTWSNLLSTVDSI
ncbi:hypothetical protein TRAPUB_2671 [Trametes pubescens]|uniref:F-box domain-containing protein n=1 Tax=Trametes pubescens TaxID=154538 RepID=A0A1M2VFZ5_TRAPU|nr:hypothetical protein TRAPUB_2671 [Trametes pubescens]